MSDSVGSDTARAEPSGFKRRRDCLARTGDPSCGDLDEAEILQCFGTVPAEEALMGYE